MVLTDERRASIGMASARHGSSDRRELLPIGYLGALKFEEATCGVGVALCSATGWLRSEDVEMERASLLPRFTGITQGQSNV